MATKARATLTTLLQSLTLTTTMTILTTPSAAAAAPPSGVDCSTLVLNMADCLSFVSNGSTTPKPEGGCCSGLKMVLKTDPECVCEGFKSSASFGVVLNLTKALALPAACKVHAPSASNCGLTLSPTAAPTGNAGSKTSSQAPAAAPTTSTTAATTVANDHAPVPAPSLGASAASQMISFSVGSLLIGLGLFASVTSF